MKTYALIPARAGSKGVKNKNLRLVNDKPLITYSIESAMLAKKIDRVIVTTDSPEIANVAKKAKAEVPFLRPSAFAQDHSPDHEYLLHALNWLNENEGTVPKLIALLRPTTPLREAFILDNAISSFFEKMETATSLRSVHVLPEPPQKMLKIENGWLTGFFPNDPRPDYFNLPRQLFPTAYHPNGYIDILKTEYLLKNKNQIFGEKMLGFETPFSIEIDTEDAFNYLEFAMSR